MTMTVNLKKMVHRKSVEFCSQIPSGSSASASFFTSDKSDLFTQRDSAFYAMSLTSFWNYSCDQDSWIQIPSPPSTGTFAAGCTGEFNPHGCPGGALSIVATGGTTTSLGTNLTLVRSLVGAEIRVTSGTNVGYVGTVVSNTIGANASITVTPAAGSAFTSSSVFRMITGSLWFMSSGAGTVGFSVYDRATNTWTARSVTGLPTTWGTDGQLVITSGRGSNRGGGFVNSTSTGSNSTTTLIDTGKSWPVNGWSNSQVRIISGTGLGQIRTISSNTATTLTVSSAWIVTPDASSVYRIEGNDDYVYLMGNNAVTLYRYSISGNSWSTLSPTAARSGAMAVGGTADWVDNVQATNWTNESYGAFYSTSTICQNGRYIYSWRGGASSTLDVYDIALNTWYSNLVYGQQGETYTTGSCSTISDGYIYLQKDATGRILRFDVARNVMEPWTFHLIPQGTAIVGKKMFVANHIDGANRLSFLYSFNNSRAELSRWIMI